VSAPRGYWTQASGGCCLRRPWPNAATPASEYLAWTGIVRPGRTPKAHRRRITARSVGSGQRRAVMVRAACADPRPPDPPDVVCRDDPLLLCQWGRSFGKAGIRIITTASIEENSRIALGDVGGGFWWGVGGWVAFAREILRNESVVFPCPRLTRTSSTSLVCTPEPLQTSHPPVGATQLRYLFRLALDPRIKQVFAIFYVSRDATLVIVSPGLAPLQLRDSVRPGHGRRHVKLKFR